MSTTATETRAPSRSEPGARLFVWIIWAGLVACLGVIWSRYAINAPVQADYDIVDVVVGRVVAGWSWLTSPLGMDRPVLPRLILLGLDRVTGHDQRPAMILGVAALSLATAFLLWAVYRMRGGFATSDAFIPLVALCPIQYENYLQAAGLRRMLTASLGLTILGIVCLQTGARPTRRAILAVGLLALALALTSTAGLATALLLAWTLVLSGRTFQRSAIKGPRGRGMLLFIVLGAFLLAGVAGSFAGSPGETGATDAAEFLGRLLQAGSLALGATSLRVWPLSGLLVLGLAIGGVVVLMMKSGSVHQARLDGLMALLGAGLMTVLTMAWRPSSASWTQELANSTLFTPLTCATYLAWTHAPSPRWRRTVPLCLFLLACFLLWPNLDTSHRKLKDRAEQVEYLTYDLTNRMPPAVLIRNNWPLLHPSQDYLNEILPSLKQAGYPGFRDMAANPAMQLVPLAVQPRELVKMERRPDGSYAWSSSEARLDFALPSPMLVLGIRLRYDATRFARPGIPTRFFVNWLQPEHGWNEFNPYLNKQFPMGQNRTVTIWVMDAIAGFTIMPDDHPGVLRIHSIELLTLPRRVSRGGPMGPGPRPSAPPPQGQSRLSPPSPDGGNSAPGDRPGMPSEPAPAASPR